ncbi:MAG: hypothetical protein RIR00_1269 [Pseudomonadota bacterium]|jgi:D-alanyl-D-alanine endopeptidase (penicillin-binding protein 7)
MKKKLQLAILSAALATAFGSAGSSALAVEKSPRIVKKSTTSKKTPKTAHQAVKPVPHLARIKPASMAVAAPLPREVSLPSLNKLSLYSSSALVLDQQTGEVVLKKNPEQVLPIASISKLMTAMVVLDANLDRQGLITIGDEDVDTRKGTHSRLHVGMTMTRETALLLALMSSENRAAHALGRHYPGGLPAFVQAMNRKAQSLGMTGSFFEEPTGLSSNNVATASDLAKMVTAAAQYPLIRELSTTAEARVDLGGRLQDFRNTNALVKNPQWSIGVSKTGYISEAGRCLVMQARVADKPVVIVLLDSVGKLTRVGDANRIKRWMESAALARDSGRA